MPKPNFTRCSWWFYYLKYFPRRPDTIFAIGHSRNGVQNFWTNWKKILSTVELSPTHHSSQSRETNTRGQNIIAQIEQKSDRLAILHRWLGSFETNRIYRWLSIGNRIFPWTQDHGCRSIFRSKPWYDDFNFSPSGRLREMVVIFRTRSLGRVSFKIGFYALRWPCTLQ